MIDLMGDSTIDVIDYECKMPTMDTLYVHVPYMLALQYRTKLPNTTQQVEEGILKYLNTRKSIQTPYAQFYTNLQRAVTFHHDQLEKLDSLTSAFYFTNNHLPQVGSDIWHSGMVLGSREIDLFLEEINTEMEVLQFTDMRFAFADAPVVLQSPFVVDTRAINGPIKCLALGIILGWFINRKEKNVQALLMQVESKKKEVEKLEEKTAKTKGEIEELNDSINNDIDSIEIKIRVNFFIRYYFFINLIY